MRALNYGKSLPDTDRQIEREREIDVEGVGEKEWSFVFLASFAIPITEIPKYRNTKFVRLFSNFAMCSQLFHGSLHSNATRRDL